MLSLRTKWQLTDQVNFLDKVGRLLKKGYNLSQAIELVSFYLPQKKHHQIKWCMDMLTEGVPLSEVLKSLSFHKDVIGYLYVAECRGDLSFGLMQSSKMLQKKLTYKQQLQKIIRYPLMLLIASILLYIGMHLFLFPQFIQLFDSMDVQAPFFTLFFIQLIKKSPYYLVYMSIVFLLLSTFFIVKYKKESTHNKMKWLTKIPYVNHLLLLYMTYTFSVQLSSLLYGGLSIYDALSLLRKQAIHPFSKSAAFEIQIKLREGERLETVINKSPYFLKEFAGIIAHGLANGVLPKELNDYGELILEKLEMSLNKNIASIQSWMYVSVGFTVVIMFLSIMLPLFQLINGM